jgi:hypothetical protein
MALSTHSRATILAGGVLFGLVAAMLWIESSHASLDAGVLLKDGVLSDAREQSLTATVDLVKLLTNWGIAVIAGTGFFLKANVDKGLSITSLDLILTFTIIVLAVMSLFLGHLVLDRIAQVLAVYQFPLNDARVRTLGRLQYLVGLGAITVFGLHIFQFFWARRT